MQFLKNILRSQEKYFVKGGKFERLYPLYEAGESFAFTPGTVTKSGSHVRDMMDLKRMMMTVVVALIPAVIMALYNTGYQVNLGMAAAGQAESAHWQGQFLQWLGLNHDSTSIISNMVLGALYFFPVYLVTIAVGGIWEAAFAIVRKHEINEGFLVTSLLFPLILPPDIPYWQVALGISFGVVIGKEVFGGVGMNILNPALTARAFLFFAYPAEISGDKVWIAVDGLSQATPLAQYADTSMAMTFSWWDSFIGLIPGSMGETSALACLIGAVILIISRVGSWKIMLGVLLGMVVFSLGLNTLDSATNPMFGVTPHWHLVTGGFAFGAVYMATDPVSASMTEQGKYLYGFLIGALCVLVRVINPAFPEGMMLAILFMNVFAPIIDRYYINQNIKRRLARDVA